jgi:hypothetical protein
LFNLNSKKKWLFFSIAEDNIRTFNDGGTPKMFFQARTFYEDLYIAHYMDKQQAYSKGLLHGYNIERDANNVNQLTKSKEN